LSLRTISLTTAAFGFEENKASTRAFLAQALGYFFKFAVYVTTFDGSKCTLT